MTKKDLLCLKDKEDLTLQNIAEVLTSMYLTIDKVNKNSTEKIDLLQSELQEVKKHTEYLYASKHHVFE